MLHFSPVKIPTWKHLSKEECEKQSANYIDSWLDYYDDERLLSSLTEDDWLLLGAKLDNCDRPVFDDFFHGTPNFDITKRSNPSLFSFSLMWEKDTLFYVKKETKTLEPNFYFIMGLPTSTVGELRHLFRGLNIVPLSSLQT